MHVAKIPTYPVMSRFIRFVALCDRIPPNYKLFLLILYGGLAAAMRQCHINNIHFYYYYYYYYYYQRYRQTDRRTDGRHARSISTTCHVVLTVAPDQQQLLYLCI